MSPSRYQVEAESIDELNALILAEYGPDAAVVATTVITTGGLQGFFAHRRFQATVELPDGSPRDAHAFDLASRAGIAGLLDDADEGDFREPSGVPGWNVSTSTVDFATILADLTLTTTAEFSPPAAPVSATPLPLRGTGDLVVVIGLGDDAWTVASAIATEIGASVRRAAGTIEREGVERVDDRRGAVAARAEGVRGSRPVVVAFGIPRSGASQQWEATMASLHADQVWVAVDAARKADDTARWVRAVSAVVRVDAAMSWAADETATPQTVNQLGLPVGWLESGW